MTFRRIDNTVSKAAVAGTTVRPSAGYSALARAVALHLEGKRKEALKEIQDAIEDGEQDPELFSARGHLHFELEQFEEAARSYQK
ncbi:MAG: hypothetical protein ACK52Z_12220, partial [Acidobacteriota bacterium]